MSTAEEWIGPERRHKLDPDDARAVLAVLVEHLEAENYLERALHELRGTVGSVSGEMGQMKEALINVRSDLTDIHNLIAEFQAAQASLAASLRTHLKQAEPVIEASESFMVLAKAGRMLWRLKWIALGVGLGLWALVRGDVPALLKAVGLVVHP